MQKTQKKQKTNTTTEKNKPSQNNFLQKCFQEQKIKGTQSPFIITTNSANVNEQEHIYT